MRYEWIWGIILPGKDKTYRKPLIFSLETLRAIRQMFACMTGFETHKSSNSYRISGECKHITPFRLRCTRVFPSMFSRYYMGGSEVMGDSQSPVVSVHEVMVLDILGYFGDTWGTPMTHGAMESSAYSAPIRRSGPCILVGSVVSP
jgi:hypothetical protein